MAATSRSSGRATARAAARAAEPPPAGSPAQDAEPDSVSVARAIALRQLTAAPRSRAELAAALARRDVPDEVAAQVLDRFTEVGLVDDAAYAELIVRSRHEGRGLGRRALAHQLHAKGVDRDVADQALLELDEERERSTARSLVRRRAPGTAGLDPRRRRRRLVGMLARKGYPASLAVAVVDEVLGADDDEWRRDDMDAPEDQSADGESADGRSAEAEFAEEQPAPAP